MPNVQAAPTNMSELEQLRAFEARRDRFVTRWILLVAWVLAGCLLVCTLQFPSVDRTQEARVLETAREMMNQTALRGWMIPVLNGKPRLEKPPLAYWLAAGSFRIFGVSGAAGRLPFALLAWA